MKKSDFLNEKKFNGKHLIGSFLLALVTFFFVDLYLDPPGEIRFSNREVKMLVPQNQISNAKEYIYKASAFVTRTDPITVNRAGLRTKPIPVNVQNIISAEKGNCVDTVKGVNFDLNQIIASLKSSQNISSIADLEIADRGLYVAFGFYPQNIPANFPLTQSEYADYAGTKTAYINYTKVNTAAGNPATYTFLNENNSGNSTLRLADNVSKRCPPDCPQ